MYASFRRNPTLSIRKPEATSVNRVTDLTKKKLLKFFKIYVTAKNAFSASRIFSEDETSLSTRDQLRSLFLDSLDEGFSSIDSKWKRLGYLKDYLNENQINGIPASNSTKRACRIISDEDDGIPTLDTSLTIIAMDS
ncbi:hypothetical protein ILUMI_02499 [Ignelater luminosus]|uniref:Uncharacterized protein n=1 Tax=Ignelater luminosus TaxID=2038154 RepID=A0A8K0GLA5_IGNLU|nr:hypothetical protein ILUMI_02499 [Ignelater luminosus]